MGGKEKKRVDVGGMFLGLICLLHYSQQAELERERERKQVELEKINK